MSSNIQASNRGEAARLDASRDAAERTRTVLVAEDDPDVRLLIRTKMEMSGYRVVATADGQQTVEAARDERPDIILMDLHLPRLNGFSVARFIRQQEEGARRVPIIVVSGHDPAIHRNLALAAGCNAFVTKPIDFKRLEELMERLLTSA